MIRSPAGFDGGDRIKRYLDYYQPSYGVMMLSAGQFSPALLFAQGEQGVWYDPSDMTTLFQDAAGTTPVTAVEQPVGLVLDKSGRGNHASQSTSASRPVLSARVNTLVNTDTLSTQSVTTLATNYTLRFEGTGSIALSGTGSGTYSAGSHTVTCTAGTLTLTVTGSVTNADLRPANAGVNLPVYQRVVTATDYDTTGFPMYLKFDGTDDSLATAAIDFSATDKMSVFHGHRILGTAYGVLVNGPVSTYATFQSVVHDSSKYQGNITTSASAYWIAETLANYSSPRTDISSILLDTAQVGATNAVKYRLNGTLLSMTGAIGGSPSNINFGNMLLTIGMYAGNSNRFNGHLYSLIICAAATDAATITATEAWVNGKTRAY